MNPKFRIPETDEGAAIVRIPFPRDLASLKSMTPIVVRQHYGIDYIHSFGQDSPWFAGLSNGVLLGTRCERCDYVYATPRLACMQCGGECDWVEIPQSGRVHTWTTCYFGSEEFLPECPFNLALIEFDGVNTLLLARLMGCAQDEISVGMRVRARFRRMSTCKPTDVYFVPEG